VTRVYYSLFYKGWRHVPGTSSSTFPRTEIVMGWKH